MKQTKQIILLPTDKVSERSIYLFNNKLKEIGGLTPKIKLQDGIVLHHLYILSQEDIKEGDWAYNKFTKEIKQIKSNYTYTLDTENLWSKVIATTNPELLIFNDKDFPADIRGRAYDPQWQLPKIPQSFIDHYITEYNKGNVITEVSVEYNDWFKNGFDGQIVDTSLKLDKDGCIITSTIKDIFSREEVLKLGKTYNSLEDYFLTHQNKQPLKILKLLFPIVFMFFEIDNETKTFGDL